MSRREAQQFMPSRRSFLRGAAGIAAVGATAAACGGNNGRSSDSGGGDGGDSGGGGGGKQIVQWYHQYGEKGTQQAAQKFADAYDKADVKMVWKPGDYDTQLATALLKTPPDVFESHLTAQMVRAKQVAPLDDIIDPIRDQFTEQDLAANTVDGKIYGLPMIDDPQFFYYRKSMFDDAGVDTPTTLDELVDIAKTITGKGKVKALYAGTAQGADVLLGPALWSTGGTYLNKAGDAIGFDGDRTADALAKLNQMVKDKSILPQYTTPWTDPSAFIQSQCAMQWCGLWAMPAIQDALKDDFGIFPFPKYDAQGRDSVTAGVWSEYVSAKSSNLDAAKAYVKWLWIDQEDYQEEWSLDYGFHIPPRKSAAAKADKLKEGPAAEAVKLYGEFGIPGDPRWIPDMNTPLADMGTNIVRKGNDPHGEFEKALSKINQAIKRAAG